MVNAIRILASRVLRLPVSATTAVALSVAAAPAALGQGDATLPARERMVREVAVMARDTSRGTHRDRFSPAVMGALMRVPRHRFVPAAQASAAYENRALAIGLGQTISQPFIVALSTDLLDLEPRQRVLEVGTGSGYQAAILAELAGEVYTIEIVEPLARAAAQRLDSLGYRNVRTRVGDGYAGWPEAAPFDRIMVTAAAPHLPAPLVDQLAPLGRMVIPVTRGAFGEDLMLVTKDRDGAVMRTRVLGVRFVPMTGPGVEAGPR